MAGFFGKVQAIEFVCLESEVGGGGDDSFEAGEFFAHEACHGQQVLGFDPNQQIISSAHQVATAHFIKTGYTLSQAIKATAALRGATYFDEGAYAYFIIIDDGSTDGTREILKRYQKQDARVRMIEGPKAGVKKNVENALYACEGAYIFLAILLP